MKSSAPRIVLARPKGSQLYDLDMSDDVRGPHPGMKGFLFVEVENGAVNVLGAYMFPRG